MDNIVLKIDVQSCIYHVRGRRVMLDSDLARLYNVLTKNLNKAVKRNIERFPIDFMFRLTQHEFKALRFQSGTLKRGQHPKYLSCAFTQEGIAMLSSVLRSKEAARVNVAIMRAFVKLRHAVLSNQDVKRRVEKLEGKVSMHDTDIRLLVQDVQALKKRSGTDGPIDPSIL